MKVHIRSEEACDIEDIEAVTTSAFLSAPHTSRTEHFIVRALRNAGVLSVSLVAEVHGSVVGHVAVSPVSISDGSAGWYGVGPLSVLPEFQGLGIGSQLMLRVLDALRESGAAGCVVLGDPGYYRRFGFTVADTLLLADVPPEYFQAISFSGMLPSGLVSYHDSFYASHEQCQVP